MAQFTTPEPQQLMHDLEELYGIFHSRTYWVSKTFRRESAGTVELLGAIQWLRAAGHLSVEYIRIPEVPIAPDGRNEAVADEYERRMKAQAYERRGQDLKNHMWSAYTWLQEQYPDKLLKAPQYGVPHLYIESESRSAVTAGNVPVEALMSRVAFESLRRVGIVMELAPHHYRELEDLHERDVHAYYREMDRLDGHCELVLMTFSPEASSAIGRLFDGRRASITEIFGATFARRPDVPDVSTALEFVRSAFADAPQTA
jgi:hypothetical protein